MPRGPAPRTFRRSPDRICDPSRRTAGAIAGRSVTCAAVPKRTRNRQLARQHERRQAERLQQQRKRQVTTIVVALVIALVGGSVAVYAFGAGDDTKAGASGGRGATSEPTTGPTGATSSPKTVKPTPGPAEVA